ncbi:MAG: DUF1559 domain-containing protein [Planctomycetaceae bacterium]|jgi:hypothetical protein|nr:DUF1559 domain-containing protein [Planctomycetaceae bacterium]
MLQKLFQSVIVSALILVSAAVFFVLSRNPVVAQETFKPLISDKCIAFIHVDFHKLELDRLKSVISKSAESFLKELNFDAKSFKNTMYEFNRGTDKIDKLVRPNFDRITKELGISELAIIIDPALQNETDIAPLLAISWKNKTEENLKTLLSLFELSGMQTCYYFQAGDFLLFDISNSFSDEHIKNAVKLIKNFKPIKVSPIYEALKENDDAEIKIAFALTDIALKKIPKEPIEGDTSEPFQKIIKFLLDKKVNWVSISMSLGRLISDTKRENLHITIKASNKKSATELHNLFENFIEYIRTDLKDKYPSSVLNKQTIPKLSIEIFYGLLRSYLPTVKGDRLVLSITVDDKTNIDIVPVSIGILAILPGIQAARSASQRISCTNNIKQIVLAFHNYHDIYKELPPIYTVDKNTRKPLHSWRVLILPFLEQYDLYTKIRLNESWDSEYNKQFHSVNIPQYYCSYTKIKDPNKRCNYVRIEDQLPNTGGSFGDITDGTSNTIAVIEVKEPFCWMDPKANIKLKDLEKGVNQKDSIIGNGLGRNINFGLWDGSAHTIQDSISIELLKAFGTANGNEIPPVLEP